MAYERLQKILAKIGGISRRKAEKMIISGKIKVDGMIVTELGMKVDPSLQSVCFEDFFLENSFLDEYWILHKPKGVICTLKDPQGRLKVIDLLPSNIGRVYPVGRLDLDSEGLVFLTNNGSLAYRLMHPSCNIEKIYLVWVRGKPSRRVLENLCSGVNIGENRLASLIKVEYKGISFNISKLCFVLNEGRKREIRRMCSVVGYPVVRLVRVALGPLKLDNLAPSFARRLRRKEFYELKKEVNLE